LNPYSLARIARVLKRRLPTALPPPDNERKVQITPCEARDILLGEEDIS
jgi:hypothetical protein